MPFWSQVCKEISEAPGKPNDGPQSENSLTKLQSKFKAKAEE